MMYRTPKTNSKARTAAPPQINRVFFLSAIQPPFGGSGTMADFSVGGSKTVSLMAISSFKYVSIRDGYRFALRRQLHAPAAHVRCCSGTARRFPHRWLGQASPAQWLLRYCRLRPIESAP